MRQQLNIKINFNKETKYNENKTELNKIIQHKT